MPKKYGIGEIFGRNFATLSPNEIRECCGADHRVMNCPFKDGTCSKAGGVCSLQCYSNDTGNVEPIADSLVATCPNRFHEGNTIFEWVGETLLDWRRPNQPAGIRESFERTDVIILL